MMRRIRLGRTGVRVPAVSLGTWAHGGPLEVGGLPVGWSNGAGDRPDEALLAAYRAGITHWDTADVYGDGRAEELIGALWDRVPRQEVFLATKVGWDAGPFDGYYHPEQVRRRLERSLRNLRTDRIDLYYLHHCDFGPADERLDGAMELLHRFRDEGKIRFIGLSDWDGSKLARLAPRVDPDVIQPYRNVLDDDYAASGLQAWVESRDAGVAFFSPLRHGLLLGKYDRPPEFGAGDHRARIAEFRDQRLLDRLRRCRSEVERRLAGRSEPVLDALLGVLLADAPTACVLLGMRRPRHVAAAAGLGEPLTAEEAAWVRRLYRGEAES